jgi:hypothetical protein
VLLNGVVSNAVSKSAFTMLPPAIAATLNTTATGSTAFVVAHTRSRVVAVSL